jgi:hypothetical protein
MRVAFGLALVLAATALADPPKPAVGGTVDFARDVWPILQARCVECHNADRRKAGLSLADGDSALAGGDSGRVILPGKSGGSRLIHLVGGMDPDAKMPPTGAALTAAQVATLRAWIDQGAKWDRTVARAGTRPRSSHWAFQPIRDPAPPELTDPAWPRNGIDRFVLARLEKEGIRPSAEADRTTLIRRLSFDLIGLPPTPAEVAAFVEDRAPDAYERLVERLLQSPHHGERWGRHWLDGARYADSDGYEKDSGRPWAWRYRDWVIRAFNDDLPYDRFVIEQLAGDLLPGATTDQKIATGFHRNTLTNKEGGVDAEEFRVAAVVDRVSTTGKLFLGLTVGCCQCHDHKYDPITQREFYQLFAFFNSDREQDIDAPLPDEAALHATRLAAHAKRRAELQKAVDNRLKQLSATEEKTDTRLKKLRTAVANHDKTRPTVSKAPTLALGPQRESHVLIRGDFLRKGVEVRPGTPAVLNPISGSARPATRLDLARWIVDPANPLARRVLVNWVWQKYFGRGLVPTAEDFGTQGEKPSHPELLDWLASRTLDQRWSWKALHRLIVMSATYRQSSRHRPELHERDPQNVLLARQARLRLEAEVVRDAALAASGLLNPAVGGPSIRPPQPAGVSELTYAGSAKWVESTGADRHRRGLYIWFQRTSPYPTLMTFDAPDSNVCTVRRERSNTPLQALALLNDVVFVEAAQALATRVQSEFAGGPAGLKLDEMMRLSLGRAPTSPERSRLLEHFADLRLLAAANPAEAAKLIGNDRPAGTTVDEAAAWVGVARTILNLDEFVTRD